MSPKHGNGGETYFVETISKRHSVYLPNIWTWNMNFAQLYAVIFYILPISYNVLILLETFWSTNKFKIVYTSTLLTLRCTNWLGHFQCFRSSFSRFFSNVNLIFLVHSTFCPISFIQMFIWLLQLYAFCMYVKIFVHSIVYLPVCAFIHIRLWRLSAIRTNEKNKLNQTGSNYILWLDKSKYIYKYV